MTVILEAGKIKRLDVSLTPLVVTGTLLGVVFAKGSPLAGVLVKTNEHTQYTNSNGYFEMSLPAGYYTVVFSKSGYTPITTVAAVPAGRIEDVSPINMSPTTPDAGFLLIVATTPQYMSSGRDPVSGATVKFSGTDYSGSYSGIGYTNVNGIYEESFWPGTIAITVSKVGYRTWVGEAEIIAGETIRLDIEM